MSGDVENSYAVDICMLAAASVLKMEVEVLTESTPNLFERLYCPKPDGHGRLTLILNEDYFIMTKKVGVAGKRPLSGADDEERQNKRINNR